MKSQEQMINFSYGNLVKEGTALLWFLMTSPF